MDKSINSKTIPESLVASVMPRFFVDERNGCIAIRDRQHSDFNIEHQGLDADLPDVVDFKIGEQIKFSNFITWDLDPEIIKEFKNKCKILNKKKY